MSPGRTRLTSVGTVDEGIAFGQLNPVYPRSGNWPSTSCKMATSSTSQRVAWSILEQDAFCLAQRCVLFKNGNHSSSAIVYKTMCRTRGWIECKHTISLRANARLKTIMRTKNATDNGHISTVHIVHTRWTSQRMPRILHGWTLNIKNILHLRYSKYQGNNKNIANDKSCSKPKYQTNNVTVNQSWLREVSFKNIAFTKVLFSLNQSKWDSKFSELCVGE
jgi:hypothetical protein